MERLLLIDGLRGLAALAVVLCHLTGRSPWEFAHGYLGVAVFFVLSGFVISLVVGEARISLGYLGRFALRRAIRLDPPYWASIACAIVLAVLASRFGEAKSLPEFATVLAHLIYAQDLLGLTPISSVYWTLCLEIQFYVFLILVMWLPRPLMLTVFFGVAAWSILEQARLTDLSPRGLFVPYWFAFSLGAATYWTMAWKLRPLVLYVFGGLVLLCSPLTHGAWFATAALTAGLLHLAARLNTIDRWLADPVMQFLGRISYSLYLFHPLIGWSTQSLALRHLSPWSAFAVGLAASLVSATLAYYLIERPAIRWSRYIRTTRRPESVSRSLARNTDTFRPSP